MIFINVYAEEKSFFIKHFFFLPLLILFPPKKYREGEMMRLFRRNSPEFGRCKVHSTDNGVGYFIRLYYIVCEK